MPQNINLITLSLSLLVVLLISKLLLVKNELTKLESSTNTDPIVVEKECERAPIDPNQKSSISSNLLTDMMYTRAFIFGMKFVVSIYFDL